MRCQCDICLTFIQISIQFVFFVEVENVKYDFIDFNLCLKISGKVKIRGKQKTYHIIEAITASPNPRGISFEYFSDARHPTALEPHQEIQLDINFIIAFFFVPLFII